MNFREALTDWLDVSLGTVSLAIIRRGRCDLISRNGHPFSSFTELRKAMKLDLKQTVLDGEIVCLDKKGRPKFNLNAGARNHRYGML